MGREHDWDTNPVWREGFLADAVRSLSKTGTLGPHEEVFRELAGVLTQPEVVQLFATLQESGRAESEWRTEFLALFPSIRDNDLPQSVNEPAPGSAVAELGGVTAQEGMPEGADTDIPF